MRSETCEPARIERHDSRASSRWRPRPGKLPTTPGLIRRPLRRQTRAGKEAGGAGSADQAHVAPSAGHEAVEKAAPVDFRRTDGDGKAERVALTVFVAADRRQARPLPGPTADRMAVSRTTPAMRAFSSRASRNSEAKAPSGRVRRAASASSLQRHLPAGCGAADLAGGKLVEPELGEDMLDVARRTPAAIIPERYARTYDRRRAAEEAMSKVRRHRAGGDEDSS